MEVGIRFSSEVYISGENLAEIKRKWEDLPLFSQDALDVNADYVELECVEDADDYTDLTSEFYRS